MSNVTASLVVQFGAASGSGTDTDVLTAEFDEAKNEGRTEFGPGDPVYFRVYTTLTSYTVTVSSGTVGKIGSGISDETETVQFVNTNEATLPKPARTTPTVTWYGTGAGSLALMNDKVTIRAASLPASKAAVGQVSYQSAYDSWQLTPPAFTGSWAIVVFVRGASS